MNVPVSVVEWCQMKPCDPKGQVQKPLSDADKSLVTFTKTVTFYNVKIYSDL